MNVCAEHNENCSPVGWRTTNQKLFNFKLFSLLKEENNNFIELLLFRAGKKNQRKFAQTKLLCPLEKGEEYEISMKIRANIFGIKSICLAFSDNFEYNNEVIFPLNYSNKKCIDISQSVRKNEWVEIKFKYQALGSEKFVCIGNLNEDNETEYVVLDKKAYKKQKKNYQAQGVIKYGIDDIVFQHINGKQCEDLEDRKISIISNKHRHSPHWKSYAKETIDSSFIPPQAIEKIEQEALPNIEIDSKKEIVLNNLNFENNEYRLSSLSISELDPIIRAMRDDDSIKIKIIGHTDLLGSREYNQALSLKRAKSVRNYLIQKGIDKEKMEVEGKGESKPLELGKDAESSEINRRVVIKIVF